MWGRVGRCSFLAGGCVLLVNVLMIALPDFSLGGWLTDQVIFIHIFHQSRAFQPLNVLFLYQRFHEGPALSVITVAWKTSMLPRILFRVVPWKPHDSHRATLSVFAWPVRFVLHGSGEGAPSAPLGGRPASRAQVPRAAAERPKLSSDGHA